MSKLKDVLNYPLIKVKGAYPVNIKNIILVFIGINVAFVIVYVLVKLADISINPFTLWAIWNIFMAANVIIGIRKLEDKQQ